MGKFSRNLKFEIAFLERRIVGFCPVIVAKFSAARSRSLASPMASPTPMLMTILDRCGTDIGFLILNFSCICGITSLRYFSNKRAATFRYLILIKLFLYWKQRCAL